MLNRCCRVISAAGKRRSVSPLTENPSRASPPIGIVLHHFLRGAVTLFTVLRDQRSIRRNKRFHSTAYLRPISRQQRFNNHSCPFGHARDSFNFDFPTSNETRAALYYYPGRRLSDRAAIKVIERKWKTEGTAE